MVRAAVIGGVLLALLFSAGCVFGVYSKQDYGPPPMAMIAEEASVADLMMKFGAPDEQIVSGDTTVFVYRKLEGMHVLGVFGEVRKSDILFVVRGGKIVEWAQVPKGQAVVILGNLTAPVIGPGVLKEE